MKKYFFSLLLFGGLSLVLPLSYLHAATLTFEDHASFDENFYKPVDPTGSAQLVQSGSTLHFTPVTGKTNATVIYNTTTTGGSNGEGGTALGTPLNQFTINASGLVLEADFKNDSFNTSNGLGFYFGLNDTATKGALVIFRPSVSPSLGNADVRFYTGSNPTSSDNVGDRVGSATNSFGTTLTDLDKYYTFRLTLTLDGANVNMEAALFDGDTQLGNTIYQSISALDVDLQGQVGLRIGGGVGTTEDVLRFSVDPIPEPKVTLMLGLALALGFLLHIRTRRV